MFKKRVGVYAKIYECVVKHHNYSEIKQRHKIIDREPISMHMLSYILKSPSLEKIIHNLLCKKSSVSESSEKSVKK